MGSKNQLTALLGLLISTVIGCSGDSPSQSHTFHTGQTTRTSIKELLKKIPFKCDSKPCPKNVGLILTLNPQNGDRNEGQCTGFLANKDNIVATNSHCIPEAIKHDPSLCSQSIGIKFLPDVDGAPAIYECIELIGYSDTNDEDPLVQDYAYFKIQPTLRQPLTINQQGLSDEENILIYKVNPHKKQLGGDLTTSACKVVLNSFFNLKSVDRWSETGLGYGCKAQLGNSGGPVINQKGQAIGILQATEDRLNQHQRLGVVQRNYNVLIPSQFKDFIVFSNFACVPIPLSGAYEQQHCVESKSKELTLEERISPTDVLNQKRKPIEQWINGLPPIFIYHVEFWGQSLEGEATPYCVIPKSQWPNYFQTGSTSSKISSEVELRYVKHMFFSRHPFFDPEYRLNENVGMSPSEALFYKIKIQLSDQGAHGRETFSEHVQLQPIPDRDIDTSQSTTNEIHVRWCFDNDLAKGHRFNYHYF